MMEKDETLQQPSESDESASAPETEEIQEMNAVSDESATGENNSLAEEDKRDDAPSELSADADNDETQDRDIATADADADNDADADADNDNDNDETQDRDISETVSAGAGLAMPAIIQTAEPEISEFQFSDEDLKTLPGSILYKIYPHRFDNRLAERQRTGISPEQWKGYMEELPCALCGVPGGKCDCRIEGDMKAYQKITWNY